MAWWRKKVVFPARRACAAVSTRVRATTKTGSGGSILKLHEDVQTCGYKDVQVMFEILTTELDVSSKQHHRKRPPPVWSGRRSSSMIAAAQ